MNLRLLLTLATLSLVLGPWALVSSSAQSGVKNLQLSGTGNQVNSGATLTAVSGSTVAINGTFSGTPTGGTLNLSNVTVTGLSGSGGGSWGSITGTLSSQTDLQSALDLKLTASTLNGYFADPSTNGSFSASAWRSDLGLVIGTNVQAYDADLATYAGITPSANVQSLLGAANYAALRALLDLEAGTDFLAYPTGTPTGGKFLRDDNTWQTIAGGGDLLAANNLSELASAATAFGNIKQAATTSATGVVELATDGETASGVVVQGNDARLAKAVQDVWMLAISDETTALTTGTAKVTFRAPRAATVTAVRASLATVSSSGTPTFDINEGGTTILSTKLTIDASEKTSTTAATAAVISDTAIADDAELTIDIDTAGTGATGAKVYLYVTY